MRLRKRNIGRHQCVRLGPRHRRGVMANHIERHWHGSLESEQGIADRVTDQNQIDAGLARVASGDGIVRGDCHDRPLAFELPQRMSRDFHRECLTVRNAPRAYCRNAGTRSLATMVSKVSRALISSKVEPLTKTSAAIARVL